MSNRGNQNHPSLSSSNRANRYQENKERIEIEKNYLIQGLGEAEEDNSNVNKSSALEEEEESEHNTFEEEEEGKSDIDNDIESS